MKRQARTFHSILVTATGIALSCAATASLADVPQAVTITTQVVFNPDANGTFVATGPICSTGTLSTVRAVIGPGPNVNALASFTCDDNSGSFILRLHPQFNARPKEDGFDANGPWSVWGKGGTGKFKGLTGHGDFGVVVDEHEDPLAATETYVGFVTLK
ncbi:MAG: hypothetical protein FJ171_07390 [Gammaproteobacteria bacterium]|nr:hypothetical protein [Gammaproteobacteria bacterium]